MAAPSAGGREAPNATVKVGLATICTNPAARELLNWLSAIGTQLHNENSISMINYVATVLESLPLQDDAPHPQRCMLPAELARLGDFNWWTEYAMSLTYRQNEIGLDPSIAHFRNTVYGPMALNVPVVPGAHLNNFVAQLAKQWWTNAKNHIWMNFPQRLRALCEVVVGAGARMHRCMDTPGRAPLLLRAAATMQQRCRPPLLPRAPCSWL